MICPGDGSVRGVLARALPVAAVAVVLGAGSAVAHGLGDDVAGKSTSEFVQVGIEHMLLGWDHLIFIIAVVVLAGAPRRAAKFITLFAAGHSLTLIVATLADWKLNADLVDVVIALSIVFVGIFGARGAPYRWRIFGAGVFGFGLVHGLGLSTRFQETGLPDDGLLPRLIAFNIGIEIGQLMAIALVVILGLLALDVSGQRERAREPKVLRTTNLAVALVGLAAAATLTAKSAGGDPYADLAAGSTGTCTVAKATAPVVLDGKHPPKNFFAPGESWNEVDFGHVVGDGFVVIRYRETLNGTDQALIRNFVSQTQGVLAGAVPDQVNALEVTVERRTLSCLAFDAQTAEAFSALWMRERLG
ncbi:MAG: HupE/UreJ family protein [Sporichthyaceae bacterium]